VTAPVNHDALIPGAEYTKQAALTKLAYELGRFWNIFHSQLIKNNS